MVQPGAGMDSKLSGFMQFSYNDELVRTPAGVAIGRRQFLYYVQFSPSRFFVQVAANGSLGQDIDFDNSRPARGPSINLSATLRPTDHLPDSARRVAEPSLGEADLRRCAPGRVVSRCTGSGDPMGLDGEPSLLLLAFFPAGKDVLS